ncbi:hypothetical protein DCC81_03655 [Chitinophaga parva]|uniref:Uncharacterized protein n=2 Tax=Chitinophaga parva TaxID=2169414 RepID=A0A2T7BLR5_9BACT|nr:hypothetical protein DCC81_03655 [Chitinophaga parva]
MRAAGPASAIVLPLKKREYMKKEKPEQFDDIAFRKSLSSQEAFEARTKRGMQPVVDIAGWPYYVNVRWNLLEPRLVMGESKVRPTINLDKDCYHNETGEFSLYYHTKKQAPFEDLDYAASLPKNVVFVKIPGIYELDPVGMAREDQLADPHAYIKKPLQLYHTAAIIELKDSPAMDIIQQNKQELKEWRKLQRQQKNRVPRLLIPRPPGRKKI